MLNDSYLQTIYRLEMIGANRADKVSLVQQTISHHVGIEGFPLLTIKRTPWKMAIKELLWFLSPSYSYTDLLNSGVTWWEPWLQGCEVVTDEMLPYKLHRAGFQRIAKELIDGNTSSTRLFVNLWTDPETPILPPCALSYQVTVSHGFLNLTVYQRSADLVCGVPANFAQYAFLLLLYAELAGLKPGNLMFVYGDLHVYLTHLQQSEWTELTSYNRKLKSIGLSQQRLKLLGVDTLAAKVRGGEELTVADADLLDLDGVYENCGHLVFPVVPVHTDKVV